MHWYMDNVVTFSHRREDHPLLVSPPQKRQDWALSQGEAHYLRFHPLINVFSEPGEVMHQRCIRHVWRHSDDPLCQVSLIMSLCVLYYLLECFALPCYFFHFLYIVLFFVLSHVELPSLAKGQSLSKRWSMFFLEFDSSLTWHILTN